MENLDFQHFEIPEFLILVWISWTSSQQLLLVRLFEDYEQVDQYGQKKKNYKIDNLKSQ